MMLPIFFSCSSIYIFFPFVSTLSHDQAKGKELTALGNKKYSVTTSRTMREADFDKAEGDLKAKKEFDRKREARFRKGLRGHLDPSRNNFYLFLLCFCVTRFA